MPQDSPSPNPTAQASLGSTPAASIGRAVSPAQTEVKFKTDITDGMRKALSRKERHFHAWAAILRRPPDDWKRTFTAREGSVLEGLKDAIPDSETRFTYTMTQVIYLELANEMSLLPTSVIQPDGSERDPEGIFITVSALDGYRSQISKLDAIRKGLLSQRVGSVVTHLVATPPGNGIDQMLAAQAVQRISDKIALLDNRAVLQLVERQVGQVQGPRQIDYSHRLALRFLLSYERQLDQLLANTTGRSDMMEVAAVSFSEAISQLRGFDTAWHIRTRLGELRLKGLRVAVTDDTLRYLAELGDKIGDRGTLLTKSDQERLNLLKQYRKALIRAGADPARPVADFDMRLRSFTKSMQPMMLRTALSSLANLRVRVTDAIDRGHFHFEQIYHTLADMTNKRGLEGATDLALNPKLTALAKKFPMLGYPSLAAEILTLFARISDPEFSTGHLRRSKRFALNLNSSLHRKWKRQSKKAEATLRDETQKVWLSDALIPHVLTGAGVPRGHFLHDVATLKHQEVKNNLDILDILLAILSVALVFIPGGGALVLVLRVGVTAYDAVALTQEYDDFITANALYDVGLFSEKPSEWGVILSAAGLGVDLPEFATIMKVAPGKLAKAAKERKLKGFFGEGKTADEVLYEFFEAYLREKRAQQIELWFKHGGKAQALGSGFYFTPELLAWGKISAEIGINSFQRFARLARKILKADLPEKQLREAFDKSRRVSNPEARAFRIEEVHEGVTALNKRASVVQKLENELSDLATRIDDAIEQDNAKLFNTLAAEHKKTDQALEIARSDLGHSTQLRAALDQQITEVEAHLKFVDVYFKANAQKITKLGKSSAAFQHRDISEALLGQQRKLEDRLSTLRQIADGTPLTDHGKYVFHEQMVTNWLGRQFDEVGSQVLVKVFYNNGKSDIIRVDNLVKTVSADPVPIFRVYDAKFSHNPAKGEVSRSQLKKKLSEGPQSRGYLAIAENSVKRAYLVDPRSERMFGIAGNTKIVLDNQLILVLNTRTGLMRPEKL